MQVVIEVMDRITYSLEHGRMKSVFVSSFRFYLVLFLVCFAFCSLGVRLVHLQVFKADEYSVIANSARGNFVTLKAEEGILSIVKEIF